VKRILAFLIVSAAIFCVASIPARAANISASAYILMDADTHEVIDEYQSDSKMLIASTTKLMTALVVLEHANLHDTIKVTSAHMVEGSSMYLEVGETVTVEELLYGLLLCSGNDAALALADACGGLDEFVRLMNEKAKALGMENSSFENPNGLDGDEHYSTAYDMALLGCAAVNDPVVRKICSTRSATINGRTMINHNKLLSRLEGCIGLKTGYTKAAGRTLVSAVERDGRTLVAVTLNDGNDWEDHISLYEMSFGGKDTK